LIFADHYLELLDTTGPTERLYRCQLPHAEYTWQQAYSITAITASATAMILDQHPLTAMNQPTSSRHQHPALLQGCMCLLSVCTMLTVKCRLLAYADQGLMRAEVATCRWPSFRLVCLVCSRSDSVNNGQIPRHLFSRKTNTLTMLLYGFQCWSAYDWGSCPPQYCKRPCCAMNE